MWAYIYQARDLLAMDESGMNGKNALYTMLVTRACYLLSSTYWISNDLILFDSLNNNTLLLTTFADACARVAFYN